MFINFSVIKAIFAKHDNDINYHAVGGERGFLRMEAFSPCGGPFFS